MGTARDQEEEELYEGGGLAADFLPRCAMLLACIGIGTFFLCRSFHLHVEDREAESLILSVQDAGEGNGDQYPPSGGGTPEEAGFPDGGTGIPDYASLHGQSPDAVAYIFIEGTGIAYPVMQHSDDEFYLTHSSDGKANRNGAIFLSCLNHGDFSDPINYIYGHNVRSGLMFSALNDYLGDGYLEKHDDCYVVLPDRTLHYRLISAFSADKGLPVAVFNGAARDTADYAEYVASVSGQTGVALRPDEELIYLITCTKGGRHKKHTIVIGRLLEP